MYPYRRLFWFGLGGFTTWWLIRSRERKQQTVINQSDDAQCAGHSQPGWSWGRRSDHHVETKDAEQQMEEHQRKAQEQLRELTDKFANMADSGLDSALNSIIALKAKIAQQRAASQAARASSSK
ncbi:hypothetical protein V565_251920 [Rhizoctonia solani 123E]|uniref:Uncharacterized protein n=1 Tax=Rhizoctonia solani 123E TaxID=1423351 RepID=A0A074RJX3_9AGAM|nr:hypothetical protein V565_251920 [Rhizoctonia solani 123E]